MVKTKKATIFRQWPLFARGGILWDDVGNQGQINLLFRIVSVFLPPRFFRRTTNQVEDQIADQDPEQGCPEQRKNEGDLLHSVSLPSMLIGMSSSDEGMFSSSS